MDGRRKKVSRGVEIGWRKGDRKEGEGMRKDERGEERGKEGEEMEGGESEGEGRDVLHSFVHVEASDE